MKGDIIWDSISTLDFYMTDGSTLSALYCSGTIKDSSGNTVTIKGSDGTLYVSGTSKYTITVDVYSTSVDTSNASECSSWSDYEVDMTK